jgi:hypothetical protein
VPRKVNPRKVLKAAAIVVCGVILVLNSGRTRLFGRRLNYLTTEFTSRDVENLVGWCLIGAGAWFYHASGDDDDSDDEVGGSAKPKADPVRAEFLK